MPRIHETNEEVQCLLDDEFEQVLRWCISGINEELDPSLKAEFEQVLRIVPSNCGEGWEWYKHGRKIEHADNKAKIERFMSNGETVVEAIGVRGKAMKYIKLKKPSMLSQDFCLLAYKADLRDQTELVKFIPAEYWDYFVFSQ